MSTREPFEAVLAESPYAQLLGVEIHEDAEGIRFTLPFRPHNIGNDQLPALHGGVIGGFLETAALLHLLWLRESDELPRTVDFSVDYLRSGRAEPLHARCSVTKHGKRVANVMMTAWQDDPAKPVAVARAHFLLSAR
ncbi:MAG: PaaI family thioesterase [Perlucidibaca sp.]